MSVRCLGIIGFGSIGKALLATLFRDCPVPLERVTVLVRETGIAAAMLAVRPYVGVAANRLDVTADAEAFFASKPDLVVECAGHGALGTHGVRTLAGGIELIVVSVGALADAALQDALVDAARRGNSRLLLTSGAIGGVDIVAAAKLSGITSLTYTSRKPPAAWAGSPAEKLVDLAALREAVTFYEGTAREAARDYPKNANVAATLALAGPGLDATRVRLIADPASPGNVHEFSLLSSATDVEMRITGRPSEDNPRTSATTAFSVARDVLNRNRAIAIG